MRLPELLLQARQRATNLTATLRLDGTMMRRLDDPVWTLMALSRIRLVPEDHSRAHMDRMSKVGLCSWLTAIPVSIGQG